MEEFLVDLGLGATATGSTFEGLTLALEALAESFSDFGTTTSSFLDSLTFETFGSITG